MGLNDGVSGKQMGPLGLVREGVRRYSDDIDEGGPGGRGPSSCRRRQVRSPVVERHRRIGGHGDQHHLIVGESVPEPHVPAADASHPRSTNGVALRLVVHWARQQVSCSQGSGGSTYRVRPRRSVSEKRFRRARVPRAYSHSARHDSSSLPSSQRRKASEASTDKSSPRSTDSSASRTSASSSGWGFQSLRACWLGSGVTPRVYPARRSWAKQEGVGCGLGRLRLLGGRSPVGHSARRGRSDSMSLRPFRALSVATLTLGIVPTYTRTGGVPRTGRDTPHLPGDHYAQSRRVARRDLP
jgi:hypothetical protein